jgi:ABC-2 type transport system permease protein
VIDTATLAGRPGEPAHHPPDPRPLKDVVVLVRRNLIHIAREPMRLSDVTIQPVLFTVLLIFVFGSGVPIRGGSYTNFALAGLLSMTWSPRRSAPPWA